MLGVKPVRCASFVASFLEVPKMGQLELTGQSVQEIIEGWFTVTHPPPKSRIILTLRRHYSEKKIGTPSILSTNVWRKLMTEKLDQEGHPSMPAIHDYQFFTSIHDCHP